MTVSGNPTEFCGQNKEGKEHSVTLTEKSGHLAWCALVALALARQNGDALSPAQENLFLTRWLAAALKQRRFSRDVAPDIEWLLKQGRQLGVSAKLASKLKKGDGFDLNDFLEQLRQMKNMGGMASLMGKLPGMGQIPDNVKSQMDDKVLVRMEAIINSMTMKERAKPEIIKGSRKRRIAAGCGMQVQDVNRLLKQFDDMQRMMKKMKKGGMAKMMRSMKGMMPPGFPGR